MEIRLIKKAGVPNAEVEAHQRIQKEFSAAPLSKNWRGYAAFALARGGRGAGDDDFDLVLVTHTNVVVVELKNWHGKRVESDGRKWFLDGQDRGASPVEVVNLKAKKLANVMKQKLGVERTPFVSAYVVMHGMVGKMELNDTESRSVLNMTEFLSFRFEHCYKQYLWGKPKFNPLNYLADYDKFFQGPMFKPKEYFVDGFRPESSAIFEHPRKLYSEFRAHAKDDQATLALLRQWDFGALGLELIGETDRSFLGLREQRVFEYVSERNEELSLSLLRPISRKSPKDVTLDFIELFALPGRVTRLTEFAHSALPKMDPEERVTLVKAVLSRFAELHDLNVAHRDVGDHCLWVDRPAKVVMAGFPAAYYPEMKTVGTFRDKVKVEQSLLPEDREAQRDATPYRRDVFMLGALSYLILYGAKPPKVSEIYGWAATPEDPYHGKLDNVLARALNHEAAARFANAREMLHGLNAATAPEQESIIDFAAFEAFRAETKERDYAVSESFVDEEAHSCYRTEAQDFSLVVKVWYGVEPDSKRADYSLRLLAFLERARAIKGCSIPGIQRVQDLGLSRGSLLLVLEWVVGTTLEMWLKEPRDLAQRLRVARLLTDTLQRLHALEIAHGDIHPRNIVVRADGSVVFIDVLDFRPHADDVYTTAYLPDHYKSLAPSERDRYSLAAVAVELLGTSRAQPTQGKFQIPRVYEELANLLAAQTLSTLEPLANVLRDADQPKEEESPEFEITVANLGYAGVPPGEMRSDNGFFHISVGQDRKAADGLRFWVTGIGRQLMFVWKRDEKKASQVQAATISQSQLLRSQTMRDAAVKMRLTLRDGAAADVQSLASYLVEHQALQAKIAIDSRAEPARAGIAHEEAQSLTRAAIPVRELWQALLDTEEEAFFTVTIAGDKRVSPARHTQILVPYHSDQGAIDYATSDQVMVEGQTAEGVWRSCGQLNLRESTFGQLSELAIDNPYLKANFRIGSKLRLVSTLEKGSFTRRRFAVDRILQDKAIVPNIVQFFEASTSACASLTRYPVPSDADLAAYSEGTRKLNPSQQAAFRKVVGNGPISLLQGPPGTGKTWFIAALLHYLITKERARRILLVSQAHEAVNTALEKAQDLCRIKGVAFDAVRLGNEAAASDAIRHLHASSLEQSYREQFKAEQRERIVRLATILGLPKPFAEKVVDLHLRLGMLADRIAKLESRRTSEDQTATPGLEARIRALLETFHRIASDVYEFAERARPADVLERIEQSLIATHEIRSQDALERLRALIRLSDEWLSALGSPDANFAEFLAKSRTVVSGTLVGIGYRGAGVVQNIYDWVIIDEAGRAAPSELAVAMQAGRRILLVGDHRQLPPTFSEDVKEAMQAKFAVEEDSMLFGSDFERIFDSDYGRLVGTKLLTQYRMAPDIGDLVSSCFYDGELESGRGEPPEYYDLLPVHFSKQVSWIDMSSIGDRGHEQTSEDGQDKWNSAEARCVMEVLRHIVEADDFMAFLSEDLQPMEPAIGIICAYSKQRELIDQLKAEATWLGGARRLVKVDTVDSYQGKENRIVILSTVRNNPHFMPGFLRSPNRINVAMSRAMERLFIVGATKMWKSHNAQLPLGKVLSKVETMATEERANILPAAQFLEN